MQVTDEMVKALRRELKTFKPDDQLRSALTASLTAALSDKQAGETFTREQMLAEVERRVERALAARSALVDVPAVEPVGDDLIGYVLRYGGMCRDCADMDGVCQSGQPCDTEQRRAVIKHTIAALAYGIKHGFIANPFQSPLAATRSGSATTAKGDPE